MYNLLIAIAAMIVAYVLTGFALGGGGFNPWYGTIPALAALIGVYLLLARRTYQQVEAVMNLAQVELMKLQQTLQRAAASGKAPTPTQLNEGADKAISIMKRGLAYARWQFLVEQQINGNIGILLYSSRRMEDAVPYLKTSFYKNWIAQAMLGCIHFKRREVDAMEEVFEKAVKANEKESLLWATYAWCVWKQDKRDKAIEILTRAKAQMTDDRIKENLDAIQNNKKMKMSPYGETWYQLQLVKPKPQRIEQPFGRVSKKGLRGR